MTDRPMSAFMLSATLHGVVVGILFLLSYAASQQVKNMPRVLELVAGEGDNYGAKLAPALGNPGVKIDVPVAPAAKLEPAPVAPPAPAPKITPAPAPKVTPAPKTEPTTPNFARQIRNFVIRGESKAKAQLKKERQAEAKRAAEEKKLEEKRLAEEKRQLAKMTKEEFDRLNKAKTTATAKTVPKVAKIDAEGIAKGVVGGSTENKVGGAGGKALVSDNDDVLLAYFVMFKDRVRREFEPPAGISSTLVAKVSMRSNADGSITAVRILRSSGSREFDNAVLAATRRVIMPPRPDSKSETVEFEFSARELDGG
jgi:colicin import membrane protein